MKKNDIAPDAANIWQPMMQQQLFRGLLAAFSYPGRITPCAAPDTPSWLALLGALVDGQSTLADPQQLLDEACWPKLEARRAAPEQAAFIVLDGSRAPEFLPNLGTLEAPETGATLFLRVASLHEDEAEALRLQLSGPGIRLPLTLGVQGLHANWISSRNGWVGNFPLGVDMVLCDARRFVALPRTTRIQMRGAA